MTSKPKDPRSTGRKRGRRTLKRAGRPYECECDLDTHDWHETEFTCAWTPEQQSRSETLDVNHINKNILDNDPANLEWLCRKCHKAIDSETAKGVMSGEASSALYGDLLTAYE